MKREQLLEKCTGPMPTFVPELRQAVREDRKTQTRRVFRPQPVCYAAGWSWPDRPKPKVSCASYRTMVAEAPKHCPYGQPGDIRYLREPLYDNAGCIRYYDDKAECHGKDRPVTWPWKVRVLSQRYMPKLYARTFCEIVAVRVERVQEIKELDVFAEGFIAPLNPPGAVSAFHDLWDKINAKRGYSWASNPWVWAITFRRLP